MKEIAIVGGGGGLGSALVRQLLDRKYKVVVIGRTNPEDERIQKFCAIDVASADWPSLYRTIEIETAAPVDAVIFVAGTAVFGNTALIPAERARQTFELNFWPCAMAATASEQCWEDKTQAGTFLA